MNLAEIQSKNNDELLEIAVENGLIENGSTPRRQELLKKVFQSLEDHDGNLNASGILAIVNDGYGFLRQDGNSSGGGDVYVSQSQIRRFGLRSGDQVNGRVRAPKEGERYFGLVRVETVNEIEPEKSRKRPKFENLKVVLLQLP